MNNKKIRKNVMAPTFSGCVIVYDTSSKKIVLCESNIFKLRAGYECIYGVANAYLLIDRYMETLGMSDEYTVTGKTVTLFEGDNMKKDFSNGTKMAELISKALHTSITNTTILYLESSGDKLINTDIIAIEGGDKLYDIIAKYKSYDGTKSVRDLI